MLSERELARAILRPATRWATILCILRGVCRPCGARSGPAWLAAIMPAGGAGVDLFFVLSSFLITTLLLREQTTEGRIDVRAFWMRRILRIWPLYFFFLWTV